MAGEEPLGIVSHDLDGDWQFLHYEEVEDGDLRDAAHLMLVHLHHHTDRFPEAQDLADLPLGWVAWRESEDDPWV